MLRIGIVGTGSIARAHVAAYQRFPDEARIVALVDPVPGRAARARDELGLADAEVYEDASAMLVVGNVDLVSIATPPATHAALTVAALDAGVHVLVEKPMAPSLEECDAMIAAAQRSGRVLSVVAQNRFRDDTATLKEVLDSGLVGSLSHVRVDSAWWRGTEYYDLDWRGTWASEGGGCTLNHAIHHLDLTLWLVGRPDSVTAVLTNAQHENSEVEDLSVAVLTHGRALSEITASVVHHGEEQGIVVQAEKARVSQPWRAVAEVANPSGFGTPEGDVELVARLNALAASHVPLPHLGHAGQVADVLAAIREGRAPAIGGADGRNAVELVTAIYQAGIERRTVDLPLSEDNPFYRAGALVERAPHFFEKQTYAVELDGDTRVGAAAMAER
ncbi:Gfo/Idh/MocA family oxidoreductase [Miniimonas arenae]|uniref:Gfo/Idh/MocA family oxidoreductase n=1 Tax=Miniimonas arenae TaxID=676201 RepID=A0A5C5BAB8_9MICO|nr:Gfo/Idh/MocA family oxidoreductase [Miniimonas arenae]TNU73127.1 Gfo/Idh/MocA family oxidoreductase [Miniimonas arenae]